MTEKFLTVRGEILVATATNLAIDLHEEGRIEFLATTTYNDSNRKRLYVFRHNGRIIKISSTNAKTYFQALVNERPRDSVVERQERYHNKRHV